MTLSDVSPVPRPRSELRSLLALPVLAAGLIACQTAPDRTIPDPLPETLEWAVPSSDGSAFLGLDVRENDSGSLESLSFDPGVRVHAVVERSPAALAGIRVDDVVVTYSEIELAVPDDLRALLENATGGDAVTLGVQRGDTVFDVDVTLAGSGTSEATDVRESFVLDPARTRGAWATSRGAILVARAEDGPVGGLPVGSRIVGLDGATIVSGRGLVQRLVSREPGAVVELTIEEANGNRETERVQLLDEGRRTTRFSIPIVTTYDGAADRSRESFVLLDLYFISLFRYEREGSEKRWSVLRFFQWASGVGELDE